MYVIYKLYHIYKDSILEKLLKKYSVVNMHGMLTGYLALYDLEV